ncbi:MULTISPECIES: cell division protein ZapA [Vibrio]|uniref:Cell division protein ZapA n=1 Tax=Vibrio proteolyticus NBRC 13287 TaxID=1219065 RepID=U2ZME1_VIBPR|nr:MULTISPECIES: cell division protein ZapA [Vibrio]NAW60236.1 cell division protein ZapA [Vibrio sp. V36_P2S2PM302]NAX21052.1 cell division protein ZapA [Vibrio sp. V39_P1S14PM300]NAX28203.1 cell division protein ZapA [Vibrio sp. V38_P2S17PM301]NAX32469.1 cell division protein ZapA [Vibrio sp. V37_P2S8PM304]GAD68931.1 cell division protein ZapA [Vibrio proteolyticus NBRC 13287]
MSNQAVEIEVLGKLTRVNCPQGQEESLLRAADDLNNRIHEMTSRTKVTNEVQLLTIAALNICYELQSKNEEALDRQALTERMEKLSITLDEVLNKVKPGQQ